MRDYPKGVLRVYDNGGIDKPGGSIDRYCVYFTAEYQPTNYGCYSCLVDDGPDTSYIGEYSNEPDEPWNTIDRKERGDMGRHEMRYFISQTAEKDFPENADLDYQRMQKLNNGGFCFIGIRADAEVKLTGSLCQDIKSGGLWGIESDSDEEYLKTIEAEQLTELRNQLLACGFNPVQIHEAFAKIEHKTQE